MLFLRDETAGWKTVARVGLVVTPLAGFALGEWGAGVVSLTLACAFYLLNLTLRERELDES